MIQLYFNINNNFKQNAMKKFFALISFCILIAMQSCSSEEDLMLNEPNSSDASLSHFDISPDLSMDISPAVFRDERNLKPSLGLVWAFNF